MKIVATKYIRRKIMGIIHEWQEGQVIELPDKKEPGEDWFEDGMYNLLIGHGCAVPIEGFKEMK